MGVIELGILGLGSRVECLDLCRDSFGAWSFFLFELLGQPGQRDPGSKAALGFRGLGVLGFRV